MAVVKRTSSHASTGKIEKYLKDPGKTEDSLISGMNCDSDNFAKECRETNMLYRKNDKFDDRKYYHVVQSFSAEESYTKLTPEQAHKMGVEFAGKHFKGHEVLIVTHTDKDHLHNHFIVNSVNLETGIKYRADNKSLWDMRRTSNEQCKQHGLDKSIQPLNKRAEDKISTGELRTVVAGKDSWKQDLKVKIMEVSETSRNPEQFKRTLKDKYDIAVTERSRTSKGEKSVIYEYQSPEMKKPCGEHRLGTDYGKESIERGLNERSKEEAETRSQGAHTAERARQQLRAVRAESTRTGAGTDYTGTTGGEPDATIAKLEAAIRQSREAVGDDESARRDRIADEQSRQRERSGDTSERSLKRSQPSQSR